MKSSIYIACLFFSISSVIAQEKEKNIPEVKVEGEIQKFESDIEKQSIGRLEILKIQPEDVGQLLQKFAGTNVKNYGGLGGLKTIAVRSLGGAHTTLIVDGFPIQNTQVGQINLGQIQVDNIESLNLQVGKQMNVLYPVSAQVSGSSLSIKTFENSFSNNTYQVRVNSKVGSFGQLDNYLGLKFNNAGKYISVFGKYRQAHGRYPYSLKNGFLNYEGLRLNNDLQDVYTGFSTGIRLGKRGQLKSNYRYSQFDQGLPGAIILYNTTAYQRLYTDNHTFNMDYGFYDSSYSIRTYTSFSSDFQNYRDPFFLNEFGGISSEYRNKSILMGLTGKFFALQNVILHGGIESRYSQLEANIVDFSRPKRSHNYGLLGGELTPGKWSLEAQVSSQLVLEANLSGAAASSNFRLNPFVSVERSIHEKWKGKIKAWYRNSFRMPTFNELYYTGVGNIQLKPEDADQISLGYSMGRSQEKLSISSSLSLYYNRVKNQILAIPTKNLFVWSMQNIGEVEARGIELMTNISMQPSTYWQVSTSVNYTFQQSVDVSNKESVTYRNQVPYIPVHSGNVDFTLSRKNTGFRFSSYLSSKRYSLNENILANEVPGFALYDFGIFSELPLKGEHMLRVQFTVKNAFNSSYAFIRYYVMPGRNYLLSLSYAFN